MTPLRTTLLAAIMVMLCTASPIFAARSFEEPDVAARRIDNSFPKFPAASEIGLEQGSVHLRFMIDAKGNVAGIEVVKSDHEQLTAAAVKAVNQWKFQPATKDGQPVPSQSQAQFTVQMQPEEIFGHLPDAESLDRKPVAIHQVGPIYPSGLLAVNMEGTVDLIFVIDQRGTVTHVRAFRSDHPQFTASATAAIKKWRFSPGMLDGQPVETRARVRFPFRIH